MTRRSRFKRTPSEHQRRLTTQDLFVLELLRTHRYLPSNYIVEFCRRAGLSASYVIKRLTVLRHDHGVIDCPPASWYAANARYRPAVYMLTGKGKEALRAFGGGGSSDSSGNEFNHELMISLFHASIAFAVQDHPKLSLITAEEILAHPSCPQQTKAMPDPFRLSVAFTYTPPRGGGQRIEATLRHDGQPYGIGYTAGGTTARLFFPGIEVDRRTEPLSPNNGNRSSIRRKLFAIREAVRNQLYRRQLGIPNCLVPFITISETHKQSMMRLVEEISGGKGSRTLLFRSIADFSSFETFPKPTGHFLTEPWERVGHPPFDIVHELKHAAEAPLAI